MAIDTGGFLPILSAVKWDVAQLAERLAVNQEVGGSSPPVPVKALQPLPTVAEPFDVVVTRRVSRDCRISFGLFGNPSLIHFPLSQTVVATAASNPRGTGLRSALPGGPRANPWASVPHINTALGHPFG